MTYTSQFFVEIAGACFSAASVAVLHLQIVVDEFGLGGLDNVKGDEDCDWNNILHVREIASEGGRVQQGGAARGRWLM